MTTTRHLCFTAWQVPQFDETKVRYMCYGEETCPTTGKLHYQGYLELFDAHRYTGIKNILKVIDCKFFPRAGRREQAIAYCRGNYTTVDGRYKPPNEIFKEYRSRFKTKREAKQSVSKSGSNSGVGTTITQPPETTSVTPETLYNKILESGFHDPNGYEHYLIMETLGRF